MTPELREAIQARLARARQLLVARGWDCLFLGQSTNLRYLTGVVEKPSERLFGAVICAGGEAYMIVPRLYEEEIQRLSALEEVRSWTDKQGMAAAVPDAFPGGTATIAVDPLLHADFLFLLQDTLPGARFVSAASLLAQLRLQKDAYEKQRLKRAAAMADAVMRELTRQPLAGRPEASVAVQIEQLFKEQGSEGVSFSPIVSAGPNAAFPHHLPNGTVIQPGQCVVLDFGGICEGYASDVTRTIFAGKPSIELERIYSIVRDAQQRAFEILRPGIPAEEADSAARRVIEQAGYGHAFIHRLGHGIGMDVHEAPYLVAGNRVPLAAGTAFSIEPGIYIPGLGGVRIEDIVFMNEDGPERLNHATRDLMAI